MSDARIISGTIHFRLCPPKSGIEIGNTEEIGSAIMKEVLLLLKTLAEKEGFFVETTYEQLVY